MSRDAMKRAEKPGYASVSVAQVLGVIADSYQCFCR